MAFYQRNLRHSFVMNPKDFSKAENEGDDVFLCEYEYNIHWHSFKRIAVIDNDDGGGVDSDDDWNSCDDSDSGTEEGMEYDNDNRHCLSSGPSPAHPLAANSRKVLIFGLQKIGTKTVPEHVQCRKQTDLERAKATLLLATLPKSLPCRDKEMDEIKALLKMAYVMSSAWEDASIFMVFLELASGLSFVCKLRTMSELAVMRNLRSEVDSGSIRLYCFVEINGLKLASLESAYSVI